MENNFSDFLSQSWNDKFKSVSIELQQNQLQQQQTHHKQPFSELLPISGSSGSAPEDPSNNDNNHHGPTSSSRLTPTFGKTFLGELNHPKFQPISPHQYVDQRAARIHSNYQTKHSENQAHLFMYRPISITDSNQSMPPQSSCNDDGDAKPSRARPAVVDSRCNFPANSSTATFQSMCSVNNSRLHQPGGGQTRDVVVDSTTPPPNVHSVSSGSGGVVNPVVSGSNLSAVLAAVVSSVTDPERKAANSIRGN